jgi:hypothetical protein
LDTLILCSYVNISWDPVVCKCMSVLSVDLQGSGVSLILIGYRGIRGEWPTRAHREGPPRMKTEMGEGERRSEEHSGPPLECYYSITASLRVLLFSSASSLTK